MQGVLADVNVQGHLRYLQRRMATLGLAALLAESGIRFAVFQELDLHPKIDDRTLWNRCQQDQWVLFTDNRNDDGDDSLGATLADSWRPGHLPILTLTSKDRLEHNPEFADIVAKEIAELLFEIMDQEHLYQPRIFVPRRSATA